MIVLDDIDMSSAFIVSMFSLLTRFFEGHVQECTKIRFRYITSKVLGVQKFAEHVERFIVRQRIHTGDSIRIDGTPLSDGDRERKTSKCVADLQSNFNLSGIDEDLYDFDFKLAGTFNGDSDLLVLSLLFCRIRDLTETGLSENMIVLTSDSEVFLCLCWLCLRFGFEITCIYGVDVCCEVPVKQFLKFANWNMDIVLDFLGSSVEWFGLPLVNKNSELAHAFNTEMIFEHVLLFCEGDDFSRKVLLFMTTLNACSKATEDFSERFKLYVSDAAEKAKDPYIMAEAIANLRAPTQPFMDFRLAQLFLSYLKKDLRFKDVEGVCTKLDMSTILQLWFRTFHFQPHQVFFDGNVTVPRSRIWTIKIDAGSILLPVPDDVFNEAVKAARSSVKIFTSKSGNEFLTPVHFSQAVDKYCVLTDPENTAFWIVKSDSPLFNPLVKISQSPFGAEFSFAIKKSGNTIRCSQIMVKIAICRFEKIDCRQTFADLFEKALL